MKIYTKLWRATCVPLAAVGSSVALLMSPLTVTLLFIFFGALGMLLTRVFVAEYREHPSGGRIRILACGAGVVGSAVCSFIGFASLLGPAVFLLAALVMASSPYVVKTCGHRLAVARWLRVWRRCRARANARPHNPSPAEQDLSALTNEQLCELWRASYLALMHPTPGQMSATVLERQRYLDEFERRNRSGFAAWLATGPLASASPLPYLIGVPTINWDDLTREQET